MVGYAATTDFAAKFMVPLIARGLPCSDHRNIYAQIIDDDKGHTLVAASSLEEEIRSSGSKGIEAAEQIGQLVGQRAKAAGVDTIVFRSRRTQISWTSSSCSS